MTPKFKIALAVLAALALLSAPFVALAKSAQPDWHILAVVYADAMDARKPILVFPFESLAACQAEANRRNIASADELKDVGLGAVHGCLKVILGQPA